MNTKINTSKAIVAYLDILGYSDLVEKEPANYCHAAIDASLHRLQLYLNKMKHNFGEIVKRHITLEIMSDSFIMVFNEQAAINEADSENPRGLFLMIFLGVVSYFIQDCMRGLKRTFRGAIVKEQYYKQNFDNWEGGTFIFSKALCYAYKAEKDIATFPRILIDKSVLEDIDFTVLAKKSRPDREILRDNDGLYYLNLYSSVYSDTALADILREVKNIITYSNKNNSDNKVLCKNIWFSNYHNDFIDNIIEFKPDISCFEEINTCRNELIIDIPNL